MTDTDSEIEAMARAISRDINQHQLDTGFAMPFDFKNGDLECDWEEYAATALAARTASRKWMEENGYVIVPMEPTEAMIKAGANEVELFDSRFSQGDSEAENVWAAMIEVYEDFPPGSADLNQASLEAMITTYKDEGK